MEVIELWRLVRCAESVPKWVADKLHSSTAPRAAANQASVKFQSHSSIQIITSLSKLPLCYICSHYRRS